MALAPPITCDAIGGPLTRAHFEGLARQHSFVDHRASGTLLLLAFAAGALPSPSARPHMRSSPMSRPKEPMAAMEAPVPPSIAPTLRCAVCRVAMQELELAEELVARCGGGTEESLDLLARTPSVLCEHLQAIGQLGHTEALVRGTMKLCNHFISRRSDELSDALLELANRRREGSCPLAAVVHLRELACGSSAPAISGRSSIPRGACTTEGGHDDAPSGERTDTLRGEVRGWPAALQLLLDQDEEVLSPELVQVVEAASGEGGRVASTLSEDDGAVSALLLLAAARSDVLLIKALCALGVCGRALAARPSAASLAIALADAVPGVSSQAQQARMLRTKSVRLLQLHWDDAAAAVAIAAGETPLAAEGAAATGADGSGSLATAAVSAATAAMAATTASATTMTTAACRADGSCSSTDSGDVGETTGHGNGEGSGGGEGSGAEGSRGGGGGWLSALHVSALLLDAEALAVMLRYAPAQANAQANAQVNGPANAQANAQVNAHPRNGEGRRHNLTHHVGAARVLDTRGRTPLHYAVHGAERLRLLVYLYSPQPFRTWLQSHSESALAFAPPLSRANLTTELAAAQNATVSILLAHHASPTAADAAGHTPIHLAAASGAGAGLLLMLGDAAAAELDDYNVTGAATETGGGGALALAAVLATRDASGRDGGELAATMGVKLPKAVVATDRTLGHNDDDATGDTATAAASSAAAAKSPECDIDVIPAGSLPPTVFHERYFKRGRPVALTNATAGWPATSSLHRAAFLERFGGAMWEPQLRLPGNASILTDYLARAGAGKINRPISFNRPTDPNLLPALRAEMGWPEALSLARAHGSDGGDSGGGGDDAPRTGLDFFVGSNGSGTPLHHHSAVWNTLIYGRKLWALLPPRRATFGPTNEHPLDSKWWRQWGRREAGVDSSGRRTTSMPSKRSRQAGAVRQSTYVFCVQEPGTLIYLPSHWAHATMNLEEGLGASGFLHDELAIGLHMQLLHAPRGVGSLQNAAWIHEEWFRKVASAFPQPA